MSAAEELTAEELRLRLSELEDTVEADHEPRITRNERWRLQARGGLKVIALMLGGGGIAWLGTVLVTVA